MKVTLYPTTKMVVLKADILSDGIPARVWEGETEQGVKCHALISRIAVDKDADATELFSSLFECAAPSAEVEAIPNRLIL